jgi:predicted house-cleaning NTP pyrophosphatase (Maf/HAM1 superfamily)
MAGYEERKGSAWKGMLDLAFDVDFAECLFSGNFKQVARLAGQKLQSVVALLEEMLAIVVANELCCVGIRFESKLLGD